MMGSGMMGYGMMGPGIMMPGYGPGMTAGAGVVKTNLNPLS